MNRRGRARGLRAATGALALGIVCVAAAGCAQPLNRTPAAAPATAGTADVRIWTDRLTLSTRQVHPDPVPRFQATDGRKFYPYPAQTDLADSPQDHPWTVICMENRYLLGEFRGHHIYLAPSFLLGSSGDIIFSSGDIIFISRRLFSWGRVSDAEGPEFRGHHIYLAPSFLLGSSGDIIFSSGDIIFISRRLFSWGRVSDAEGPGRRCSPIP